MIVRVIIMLHYRAELLENNSQDLNYSFDGVSLEKVSFVGIVTHLYLTQVFINCA